MSYNNAIEPTYAAWTTSCRSILTTNFTNLMTNFVMKLSREWTITNAACICFTYTYNASNFRRTNSSSNCYTTSNWVRRCNEWIRTVVNIKHNTLCTFK